MTVYDSNTREFVINTPCESAQKYWIGGAANVRIFLKQFNIFFSYNSCPLRLVFTLYVVPASVLSILMKQFFYAAI